MRHSIKVEEAFQMLDFTLTKKKKFQKSAYEGDKPNKNEDGY